MSAETNKAVAEVLVTLLLFVKKQVGFRELKAAVSANWREIMIFIESHKEGLP